MVFALYFAMTAGEFRLCGTLPPKVAWLSCHFSPYGTGLSNIPSLFPQDGLLIVDDSSPVLNHDPTQIAEQIKSTRASSVLLDFQRPPTEKSLRMADALVSELSCPVGVAESHAENLDCPVLLPPPPLYLPLEQYIKPWQDREIWLEVALGQACIAVTKEGLGILDNYFLPDSPIHFSQELACAYQLQPEDDRILFLLHRSRENLDCLLKQAEALGIARAIGLYQELQ